MSEHAKLPDQWKRAVETAARSAPANAPLDEVAATFVSIHSKAVPMRRRAKGRGYEPVPINGGFHDPWAMANYDVRGIRQHRERWQRADAIGVRFSFSEYAFFVLDPDDRTLTKFTEVESR